VAYKLKSGREVKEHCYLNTSNFILRHSNINKVRLAVLIKKAAELHENSWNTDSQKYTKTTYDAAKEAFDIHSYTGLDVKQMVSPDDYLKENVYFAELIGLLLSACWNDALEWADRVLDNR
jgi:hypothetical protein